MAYETLEVRREDGTNRLYWRGARVFVEKSIRDEVDRLPRGAQVEAECRYDAGAVTVVRIVKVVGGAVDAKTPDLAAKARELMGKNHVQSAAELLGSAEDRVAKEPKLLLLRFEARSRLPAERDGAVRDFRRLLELLESGSAGAPDLGSLTTALGRADHTIRLGCEGDLLEYLEAHRDLPQLHQALGTVAPTRWPRSLQTRWLRDVVDDGVAVRDPRFPIVCDLLAPHAAEPFVAELLRRAAPMREEYERATAAAARERQAMLPGVEGVEAVFGVRLPLELRRAWYRARDLRWQLDGARLELIDLHQRVPKHLLGLAKILADKTVPGEPAAPGRGSPILPFAGDGEEVRFLCLWLREARRGREFPVVSVICGHDLSKVHAGEPPVIEVFADSFADALSRASAT